ncbi:MAG: TRAP transporter substrate-binding protein DctP [Deltaproteobacteria bacterium]|nr:TRAP transporter substrate-binding protein DctP [Deltaproteobacteria bacterium]
MRKNGLFVRVLVLCLFALAVQPGIAQESTQKIKFAHLGPPKTFEDSIHGDSVAFKYIMEKRSGGRFQVEIYPAGTLGKEIDMMEAVKNNVIQVHQASMAGLYRIFPPALLPFAPYVFRNEAIADEVMAGPFGQKLLDLFTEKTGIKGLVIVPSTYLVITNSVRPIRTPADMAGIKFRGMDTLQVTMFKSFGASGVPVSWPETYTSLQTGVVQGQTNPAFIVSWAKLNEVQKYMTLANSQFGEQWLVCNKSWYDALSAEDKRIVRDASKTAVATSAGLSVLLDDKAITELREKGMQINSLTDKQILEFQKLARPACLTWLKTQMDPKLVDELLKATEDAEKKLGY